MDRGKKLQFWQLYTILIPIAIPFIILNTFITLIIVVYTQDRQWSVVTPTQSKERNRNTKGD